MTEGTGVGDDRYVTFLVSVKEKELFEKEAPELLLARGVVAEEDDRLDEVLTETGIREPLLASLSLGGDAFEGRCTLVLFPGKIIGEEGSDS